jgi:hypothetical protein
VPYQPESPYFVNLDAPPPISRHAPQERQRHWDDSSVRPAPEPRRRRRRFKVRPSAVILLPLAVWVGWAYTTPGGPSARINDWIDRTRGNVEAASAGPGLHQTASYFNQLYAVQGDYPNMSDTAIQGDPKAGFGLSMNFLWCGPQAVVLQSLSAGGSVSRLLVAGKDLGEVSGSQRCPVNLAKPAPWKPANAG